MKVFIDTNVVLDFYNRREEFFAPAAVIFDMAYRHQIELCASAITFVNAFYILRKKYEREELYKMLESLSGLCEITPVDHHIVRQSLSLRLKDFEDVVQYYSAKQSHADCIVTRNKKDFEELDGKILTPVEFLEENYA